MLQVDVCWCQIYANDLESQSEFNGFREWLHTFELYRGKKSGDVDDDDSRIVGKFKVGSHFLSSSFTTVALSASLRSVHTSCFSSSYTK